MGSQGFRSGFMLRELDWLHELNIQYDASTFDTDPFEPQPDGVKTVFPFWVPRRERQKAEDRGQRKEGKGETGGNFPSHDGYAQLPYTLPQDSTLFLLLRESTPEIWLRKLDWIAKHGGMALVNVHPDYLRFPGEPASSRTFPATHYIELLEYVKKRHTGVYWQPLPREMAEFCSSHKSAKTGWFPDRTHRA